MTAPARDGAAEPTYEAYLEWHVKATQRYLEPARSSAERMLVELLDTRINPVDRSRFRISTSRVKSPQRSFAKLSGPKYLARFTTYDAVPDLIDDLVGLRLICNNLSDINTFQEVVGELPTSDGTQLALSVERDSQRDYFAEPKPSGYRAFHLNFVVPVAQAQGTRRIRVELQARTLLQDGWGELTHEDTYKPGSSVPDWIVRMSLRMADLLAAVDNIAQDLRTGLDVETQRAVELETVGPVESAAPAVPEPIARSEIEVRNALVREVRSIVESLSRPTGLDTISQELSAVFGTDIARQWARSGGFRKFLVANVGDVAVTGPMPGYVHPPGSDIGSWPAFGTGSKGVPDLITELRTYEKTVPLLPPERMAQAIAAVAETLASSSIEPTESGRVSSAQLAGLARHARAEGESHGHVVVRPHAHYILLALNRAGAIGSRTTVGDIRKALENTILGQLEEHGLIKSRSVVRAELQRWLSGG